MQQCEFKVTHSIFVPFSAAYIQILFVFRLQQYHFGPRQLSWNNVEHLQLSACSHFFSTMRSGVAILCFDVTRNSKVTCDAAYIGLVLAKNQLKELLSFNCCDWISTSLHGIHGAQVNALGIIEGEISVICEHGRVGWKECMSMVGAEGGKIVEPFVLPKCTCFSCRIICESEQVQCDQLRLRSTVMRTCMCYSTIPLRSETVELKPCLLVTQQTLLVC